MSSWKEVILQDVVEKFIDYRGKTPEKTTSGIPLVTAKIVKNGAILQPNEFVSEETYKEFMTRGFPKINDVVLTTEAPLGEVALLKDDSVALAQRIILIRGKKDVLDNAYLKYFLQSEEGQYRLDSRASGTTVFGIKASVLKEMPILIPSLEEQKVIAAVLSSLDDKIDLLHRQNQTLESLAQTLFRQWFIEEAKEEWEVGILGDYIDIIDNRGKTPPFLVDETEYPIIEVNALSGESRLINYSVIKKFVAEETYNSWFRAGHPKLYDTLLSTVGSIGEIAMFLLEKGSIAQNVVALRAKNISPFYLYENIKFMQNELKELDIGSVQPSIKVTHLIKVDFVKPDDEILKKFDEQMMSISTKIIVNSQQIKTIENLRDTLLPKLLSGEVRVKI